MAHRGLWFTPTLPRRLLAGGCGHLTPGREGHLFTDSLAWLQAGRVDSLPPGPSQKAAHDAVGASPQRKKERAGQKREGSVLSSAA